MVEEVLVFELVEVGEVEVLDWLGELEEVAAIVDPVALFTTLVAEAVALLTTLEADPVALLTTLVAEAVALLTTLLADAVSTEAIAGMV